MERRVQFSVGEYYHIYNRGVEKRKIFINKSDYERFIFLLYILNQGGSIQVRDLKKKKKTQKELFSLVREGKQLVSIGAYCLMPNHFHLLMREEVENGISKFMLKLQTAYSMYFNIKNDRSGSLFQGPFKAENVGNNDNYLTYLFSYIHTNPVKILIDKWKDKDKFSKKEIEDISSFPYSSISEYLGKKRPESIILTKENFDMFEDRYNIEDVLDLWFTHRNINK